MKGLGCVAVVMTGLQRSGQGELRLLSVGSWISGFFFSFFSPPLLLRRSDTAHMLQNISWRFHALLCLILFPFHPYLSIDSSIIHLSILVLASIHLAWVWSIVGLHKPAWLLSRMDSVSSTRLTKASPGWVACLWIEDCSGSLQVYGHLLTAPQFATWGPDTPAQQHQGHFGHSLSIHFKRWVLHCSS